MGFISRKLLTDPCGSCYKVGDCRASCFSFCTGCLRITEPRFPDQSPHHVKKILLISFLSLFAACLLCVSCYAFYVKFCVIPSRRRRAATLGETRNSATEEFIDEDHGPVVDHPIWYIHTIGLQSSVISSIALCKYKKGEGLIEGTECSVCLCEFEEDENLRLLPKCSHAFHINCIDTWLRSHTNCPMCRAPIVASLPPRGASPVSDEIGGGASVEETLTTVSETQGEIDAGATVVEHDSRNEGAIDGEDQSKGLDKRVADDELQPIRRTVSLDSLSSSNVCKDVKSSSPGGEFGQNSGTQVGEDDELGLHSRPCREARRHGCSSSNSGRKSVQIMRSFSLGNKSFSSKYSRNRTPAFPL